MAADVVTSKSIQQSALHVIIRQGTHVQHDENVLVTHASNGIH